jgi:hypothetical protein
VRTRSLPAALALLLGLGLASPAAASAAPTVHLKAEPLPIPGFRHTGYILGAGSALEAEFTISGTEYGGFPPPLIGVHFYFPTGTAVHPAGFPTCAKAALERSGSKACPPASSAGPVGHARGIVSFGDERVEESTTIESFYAPSGGIEFFADGHSPVSLEVLSSGHYVNLSGAGGYGLELVTEVPLVSTVPGAAYASVESISVEAGSAYRSHGRAFYYGTLPHSCPAGGFPLKAEAIFDVDGADPPVPEAVTVSFKAPCPRK